jgi:Uncharacterised protein family (UPF0259)
MSIKEYLVCSWRVFRAAWGTFLLLGTMYVFLSQGLSAASEVISPIILDGIRMLALAFTSVVLTVMAHKISEHEVINLGESFTVASELFWQYIVTAILYFLLVSVGFILFLIPGIIWSITYLFAPYIVVAEGITGRKALSRSAAITKGNKIHIILHELIFVVLFRLLTLVFAASLTTLVGIVLGKPFIGFEEPKPEWIEVIELFGNIAWEIFFIIFNVLLLKSLYTRMGSRLDFTHSRSPLG